MDLKEGHTLIEGQRVKLNLNPFKEGKFSIEDCQTGKVVGYAESVLLKNVQFLIDREKQEQYKTDMIRNIHAVVVGCFVVANKRCPKNLKQRGYYNPSKVDTFVNEETRKPLYAVEWLYCYNKRVYF